MPLDRESSSYVPPVHKRVLLVPGLPFKWNQHPDWEALCRELQEKRNATPILVKAKWDGLRKWLAVCPVIHRLFRRKLADEFCRKVGFDEDRPAVIAHSFGAVVVGRALQIYQRPMLKLGEVLLIGSALHTKFHWDEFSRKGQVGDYYNVVGKKDRLIKWAYRWERFKSLVSWEGLLGGSGFKGIIEPRVNNGYDSRNALS